MLRSTLLRLCGDATYVNTALYATFSPVPTVEVVHITKTGV
jgi:hypothetical protein